jgi:hypothetical protein
VERIVSVKPMRTTIVEVSHRLRRNLFLEHQTWVLERDQLILVAYTVNLALNLVLQPEMFIVFLEDLFES